MDNNDDQATILSPEKEAFKQPLPETAHFKLKTIENLLKNHVKLKVNENAVATLSELLRIYTLEIFTRAAEQSMKEGSSTVTLEHLEKVLAQFLLDFN